VIPYENDKMLGPYTREEDGRKYMKRYNDCFGENGTTVSYPKYLMEIKLGRYLEEHETVDHIDRDFTNDDTANLRILSHSKHAKEDAIHRCAESFMCQICNKTFTLTGKKLHNASANKWRNRCGPFCSRKCAGKASHRTDLIVLQFNPAYKLLDK
jgi:hypothetical protein